MTLLRRLAYVALTLAFAHIVFGAVVRITGSGFGCGDYWPTCHGYWIPPFSRPDLVIEVLHRYFALALGLVILALFVSAFVRRREPGVAGPGGVLRPAALATVLVGIISLLGAVIVKLELTNRYVVVAHLALAMALLAALAVAVARAGGLGVARVTAGDASKRTARGAVAAAGLAFAVLLLGALTANLPGAAESCRGFPHCREIVPGSGGGLHVQLTHRVLAFILFFHATAIAIAVRRRRESAIVVSTAWSVVGLIVVQLLIAAAMVELRLPPVLRSVHQAVGALIWIAIVTLVLLARRGARGIPARDPAEPTPAAAAEPDHIRAAVPRRAGA